MASKRTGRVVEDAQSAARMRIHKLEDQLESEVFRDRVGTLGKLLRRAEVVYANRFAERWVVMEEWSYPPSRDPSRGEKPISVRMLGVSDREAFFASGRAQNHNDEFCGVRLTWNGKRAPATVTLRFPDQFRRFSVPVDFSVDVGDGQTFAFSPNGRGKTHLTGQVAPAYYVFACFSSKAAAKKYSRRF